MTNVLGLIANPQMADIAGAIDYREQKMARDEAKRKQIKMNELMGKALSSGLQEGSALHTLATQYPEGYIAISKAMGFDPADGSGMHQMSQDVYNINMLNGADPTGAKTLEFMESQRAKRSELGLNVGYFDKGIEAIKENPGQFMRASTIVNNNLNPLTEEQKLARDKFDFSKTQEDKPTWFQKEQVAHWNATAGAESNPEMDNAITDMATRILAGEDKSKVIGNFGRGAQGAADLRRLEMRMAELRRSNGISTTQQLTNQQDVGAASKAVKDFDTGKHGNSVRSFNVSLSHLDTLDKLTDALDNGDMPAFNKIANFVAEQTGSTAPTDFNAAKNIVSDEIVKAIIGAGGGVSDREEAASKLSNAKTPEQLKGVISTYKELMAGQLKGLKKQYESSTNRDDFHKYLSDEARPYMNENAGTKRSVASSVEEKQKRLQELRANQKF